MNMTRKEVMLRDALHDHYQCNGKYACEERTYCRFCEGENIAHDCDEDCYAEEFSEGFIAGWDAAKQELLKEFRDHFCDAYCQYFGNDAYCRCCPIKNENCWLNGDDNNGTTNRSEKPNSSK